VLRRREPGRSPDCAWDTLAPITGADGKRTEVNVWLAEHPEMILGEVHMGDGHYRADELTVRPTGPLAPLLAAAVDLLAASPLRWSPRTAPAPERVAEPDDTEAKEGAILVDGSSYRDGSSSTLAFIDLEPGGIHLSFAAHEIPGTDAIGLCNRLAGRTRDLDVDLETCRRDLARVDAEVEQATARIGMPFDQALRLETLLARQAQIVRELENLLTPKEEAA
jgi:hypothetical protein